VVNHHERGESPRLYADVVADQPDETFETFDKFCERLNVTPDEYPHAFAAWLDRNWNWDGRYDRVEDDDQPPR
jgi:hypothetical protein